MLSKKITFNNRTATSAREKAELFNSYFCSVFRPSKSTTDHDVIFSSMACSAELSDITNSTDEGSQHNLNLNPSKALGPDRIPGRILKECSSAITPSLCKRFNNSLRLNVLPLE